MIYKTQRIIKPIIEFLETCPFLDEFNIDMRNIDTQKFSEDRPTGTAIDYIGSDLTEDGGFADGMREVARQANFQIWLKRQSNDNVYRTEVAEFIYNFERWVDCCQYHGLVPKIGDDPIEEKMWADNGMYFSEWEDGKSASLYLIRLHIIYQKDYEMEE